MHSTSHQLLTPELDQVRATMNQVFTATGTDPAIVQRGILEWLVAHRLQSRQNLGLDEALDLLAQELDINCALLQPEHERLKDELNQALTRFNLNVQSAKESLAVIELF